MTPAQQKAKELVDKFKPLVTTWNCYLDLPRNPDDITVDAKQCALICVEKEIEAVQYVITKSTGIYQKFNTPVMLCIDILNPLLAELNEVKQAIHDL